MRHRWLQHAVVPCVLDVPRNLRRSAGAADGFSAGKTASTLVLDWGLPESGSPPSSYLLNVSGAFVGSVPFTTRGFMGQVPGGTYTLTLAAVNTCGVSSPTLPLTITVP